MSKQQGFTLIELMIVVAIIGLLAAVAIPQYQNYVIRSYIVSALSELNGGRSQYELILNEGANSAAFTPDNLGLDIVSHICDYYISSPSPTGEAKPALECKLKNVAIVSGESVYLNRTASGTWGCSTSAGVEAKYKPNNCT